MARRRRGRRSQDERRAARQPLPPLSIHPAEGGGVSEQGARGSGASRSEIRLTNQIVKEHTSGRWPITDEIKNICINESVAIITGVLDPRARNAAVANVIKMEAQNQKDQAGPAQPDLHLHQHNHFDVMREVLDGLEQDRPNAINTWSEAAVHRNSRTVGADHQSGGMEADPAP